MVHNSLTKIDFERKFYRSTEVKQFATSDGTSSAEGDFFGAANVFSSIVASWR